MFRGNSDADQEALAHGHDGRRKSLSPWPPRKRSWRGRGRGVSWAPFQDQRTSEQQHVQSKGDRDGRRHWYLTLLHRVTAFTIPQGLG